MNRYFLCMLVSFNLFISFTSTSMEIPLKCVCGSSVENTVEERESHFRACKEILNTVGLRAMQKQKDSFFCPTCEKSMKTKSIKPHCLSNKHLINGGFELLSRIFQLNGPISTEELQTALSGRSTVDQERVNEEREEKTFLNPKQLENMLFGEPSIIQLMDGFVCYYCEDRFNSSTLLNSVNALIRHCRTSAHKKQKEFGRI